LKSNVSDYLKLVEAVYIDACTKCIADVSDLRDLGTLRSRVEKEGFSFLTITLPQFCRDFERSLENRRIDSTSFQGFRKLGSIPAFLRGMISLIFNQETGRIYDELHEDTPTIIEGVRQICLLFKKIEVACTPEREYATLASFKETEQSFETFSVPREARDDFNRVAFVLWSRMLLGIKLEQCAPRHGPGATAEGISGNQKYTWQFWNDRLEPYFPIIGNGYPLGLPPDSEELKKLTVLPVDQEHPVKVVLVPKTLKSPRVIAVEPVCMQFVQQGIRNVLYDAIESYPTTAGHVNFRDQSINQKLAMTASSTGLLATIDLSDASDRVPRDLALGMFDSNPDLRDAIDSCRSTSAILPSGEIISPLRKFASMGSALCFPVEAMYFYTICVVALLQANNLPVTYGNCFKVSRDVHVYGDDIVVPSANAVIVLDYLHKYNCRVNLNKTFVSGSFRESCGIDAYDGKDVTPLYIRRERPENKQQADRLVSWVETGNLFYRKGYWRTTSLIFHFVERTLGHSLPYVSETSPVLGRFSYLGYQTINRWNRSLQRFEVKGLVPSPVYRTDELEGYGALSKSFLKLDDLKNRLVSRDALHLERSARHHAVALKRGWHPVA